MHNLRGSEGYFVTFAAFEMFSSSSELRKIVTPLTCLKQLTVSPIFCLFVFLRQSFALCPGWSAMVQSQLTTFSTSWVQAILLSHSPKQLGLQACTTMPG